MMKTKLIIASVIIVIFLATGGYLLFSKNTQAEEETVTVQRKELVVTVEANAVVRAEKRADLSFKIPGEINALPIETGDSVTQGQFIASIDALDIQKAHEKSLEQFMIQRYQFDQIQKDEFDGRPETDPVQREKEKSQHRLNTAIDDVEISQWAMGETAVYAPFAGVVTDVSSEVGSITMPGQAIVTIQQTNTLKILAEVPEKHIAKVQVGDSATLDFEAFEQQTFQGNVSKIHPAETLISGNVMYYTEITSTELPLQVKPGMSVEVDILTDKRQALVVPYYILRNVDGENAEVLVQTEGTEDHEVRSVTIGTVGDDAMAEIRDGLREGEVLVWEVE